MVASTITRSRSNRLQLEFYQFSEELSRGPANHHHLPGQEPQSSTTERTQGSA
jgi:hypothetical protein